jgi:uncharacterized cupredoxin-like copper-binding protein
MSSTIDKPPAAPSLEDELHALQSEEREFETRVQKSQIAVAVAAFAGLILALTAFVVALSNKSDNTTVMMRGRAPAARPATGMPGGAMMGGARSAATSRTITAQLGEMYVRPSATSIGAGKVTFVAHNQGQIVHELMVERIPMKMEGPGKPVEKAAQGMIEDLQPGASGKMTLRLKPGTYMLFCNVPGHYAAGQHTLLTVTKS